LFALFQVAVQMDISGGLKEPSEKGGFSISRFLQDRFLFT
jgi:hypothetical protein